MMQASREECARSWGQSSESNPWPRNYLKLLIRFVLEGRGLAAFARSSTSVPDADERAGERLLGAASWYGVKAGMTMGQRGEMLRECGEVWGKLRDPEMRG